MSTAQDANANGMPSLSMPPPPIVIVSRPKAITGANVTPLGPQNRGVHTTDPGAGSENWADVLTTTQHLLTAPTPLALLPTAQTCSPDDFSAHPLIYKFDKIVSNPFHLDSLGIPNALLQMAFKKIFIPLSMLTAVEVYLVIYNPILTSILAH